MNADSVALPPFMLNTWSASNANASAINPSMQLSVQRLSRLLEKDREGEDDYGRLGPTMVAFKNALLLVVGAISILGKDVQSSPAVDSQGGIRVTWRCGDSQVKLVCPATADAPIYIYQSSREGNSLRDQNVTSTALAKMLARLLERDATR